MIKWLRTAFRAITGRRDGRLVDPAIELAILVSEWLGRQREIERLRKGKKRTSHLAEKQRENTTLRLEIERELGWRND